jgi:hypothetical protein
MNIRLLKRIFLVIGISLSLNTLGQTLTLVCNGIKEEYYQTLPEQNTREKGTTEYKFVDGKFEGKYHVTWNQDEILYECRGGMGNGCNEKDDPLGSSIRIDFHQIRISRNTGEVTEFLNVNYSPKMKLSNSKYRFKGSCSKLDQKKF